MNLKERGYSHFPFPVWQIIFKVNLRTEYLKGKNLTLKKLQVLIVVEIILWSSSSIDQTRCLITCLIQIEHYVEVFYLNYLQNITINLDVNLNHFFIILLQVWLFENLSQITADNFRSFFQSSLKKFSFFFVFRVVKYFFEG